MPSPQAAPSTSPSTNYYLPRKQDKEDEVLWVPDEEVREFLYSTPEEVEEMIRISYESIANGTAVLRLI